LYFIAFTTCLWGKQNDTTQYLIK